VMHPVLEEGPGNIKRKQVSSRDLCDIPLGWFSFNSITLALCCLQIVFPYQSFESW
jgi:hypothetical protein